MSADRVSQILRGLAAFLAGAAGLALESTLTSSSGLALGYGGSVAIGLSVWLAAWAAGAWLAGHSRARAARALWISGLALAALAPLSVWVILRAGNQLAGSVWAPILAVAAIALPALAQGFFLPFLARGTSAVGGLIALNLAGSLCGAYAIADLWIAAHGRMSAAALAGVIALVAGLVGARAHVEREPSRPPSTQARERSLAPWQAACIVGFGTAWMSALEWILLRLGVLWFGGMQNALNAVLCASLLAFALGAFVLPRLFTANARGVAWLACTCALGTLWPSVAAPALRATESAPMFLRACVLCVPALIGFGALIPLVHGAALGAMDSGERLGRLLVHEVWGALLGIPLVHFAIVPLFGLSGALAAALACGVACGLALVPRSAWSAGLVSATCVLAAVFAGSNSTPARASPPLSNPAFTLRSVREDRDFTVAVVDDGMQGERTLLTDGFRAAGTGRDYRYMEALGHLPLLLHPHPSRVAVLALGTGTTLGAVVEHDEVEHVDVLEISRAVVASAPDFLAKNHGALVEGLPGLLDENDGVARVVVRLGDGRATLARRAQAYDVITMEPLLPDSPFAVYLYTREFYAIAKRALAPGGLVCQWVPPHALEPVTFDAVVSAFGESFRWSGAWLVGTQLILVGGDAEPALAAARFAPRSPAVDTDIAALGLNSPADLVARWCGSVSSFEPASARSLSDADPWIVYRERRRGGVLLTDLCRNLARIDELPHELSANWLARSGPGAQSKIEGVRALHAARVAHAWREAEARGVRAPDSTASDFEPNFARARTLLPFDPEFERFADDVAFVEERQRGLSALASGTGREAAEMAQAPLISAAKRRPERADVHLYCAVMLERLGSPNVPLVLDLARSLCPDLARTKEAEIARKLGLSDASWALLAAPSRP